jgi:hypothetical protein
MPSMTLKPVPPCAQSWHVGISKPIPVDVSLNNFHLGEQLVTMCATQCVYKSYPIKIGNHLLNGKFQLQ